MENSQSAVQKYMKTQGLEVLPDNNQYKNRFNIKSESSNRLYVVAQRLSDGEWTCSCPGWIIAKKGHNGRTCKHIKTLAPMLNAVEEIEKKQIG